MLGDPTNNERTRWVAAMRAKGNIDPDLIVRRYAEAETLSFMILGDPGEGDDSQYHVLRPLYATAGGTAFTYIVSDVIYPAGDVNEYEDKFFWPYRNLPGPIYAIPGNHDWYDGLHGFMTHFCAADPDKRPKASKGRFFGRILRKALWREPNPMRAGPPGARRAAAAGALRPARPVLRDGGRSDPARRNRPGHPRHDRRGAGRVAEEDLAARRSRRSC